MLVLAKHRIFVSALAGNPGWKTDTTNTVVAGIAGIAAIAKHTAADRYTSAATDFLQTKVNPPLRNLVHVLD